MSVSLRAVPLWHDAYTAWEATQAAVKAGVLLGSSGLGVVFIQRRHRLSLGRRIDGMPSGRSLLAPMKIRRGQVLLLFTTPRQVSLAVVRGSGVHEGGQLSSSQGAQAGEKVPAWGGEAEVPERSLRAQRRK